ncbi:membrane protein [Saccharopolyspora erythraea NRRL 2338]|uniref:Membrane protein n=3 Tax=Saccharopolyspora erythraea TaxID=1836 RepID=A4FKE8_SACEN|nr:membrane protein [Saccharopolyspora erythraea NRRL 2338]
MAVAAAAAGLALLLAGHAVVPGAVGTMLDSVVPWLGLGVPLVAAGALLARSRAVVAVLVPALVWVAMFGPALLPSASAQAGDLRVATQNLYAQNPDPAATAHDLASTGADLIGVQEMAGDSRQELDDVLADRHPHHRTMGTVGLWSSYPIRGAEPVDLGLGWTRAMRASITTPSGPVTVYVAHLPSLRPDSVGRRDLGMAKLAAAVADDDAERVIVLADLNTAGTDPQLGRLHLQHAQRGLGFTWPAAFPVARLDHVLYRGVREVGAEVVRTRGTDHRAATADFAL